MSEQTVEIITTECNMCYEHKSCYKFSGNFNCCEKCSKFISPYALERFLRKTLISPDWYECDEICGCCDEKMYRYYEIADLVEVYFCRCCGIGKKITCFDKQFFDDNVRAHLKQWM